MKNTPIYRRKSIDILSKIRRYGIKNHQEVKLISCCVYALLFSLQAERAMLDTTKGVDFMAVLSGLQPENVFGYFEQLCAIPHGSRNTKAISDFCVDFARHHQLDYIQDGQNNVILFAPPTAGYEDAPPVMIQGHLDMVCEKESDCDIDMQTDGLRLRTDGGWVWADGTTLGGDDGIAVAYALAILASETVAHPALEVVLTVDEEIGMLGAASIDVSMLRARRALNIDSEEEGYLLASCAGGLTARCDIPVTWEQKQGVCVQLQISGMSGGHSGMEIDKGRANSNLLMGRFLYELSQAVPYSICQLAGGMKDNAIARETTADIIIHAEWRGKLLDFVAQRGAVYRAEYQITDPHMSLTASIGKEIVRDALTAHSKERVLSACMLAPNGVQRMSADIVGLVQTSLNCGIMVLDSDALHLTFSVRSSVDSEKTALTDKLHSLCHLLGGSCQTGGEYPAWEYRQQSPLRELMIDVFTKQYGHPPVVQAIHAGLECGLLAGKLPGLDCISFGPDMKDIHTTKERMSVASVQRTWKYLVQVLEQCR